MNDLAKRLAELPPEKRKLLAQALKRKGEQFNSFPLSFAQQRLWFLQQLEPNSALYTIPGLLHLRGELRQDALEASLYALIQRHEALRTIFLDLDGEPVQLLQSSLRLPLAVVDLQALPAADREAELRRLSVEQSSQPFDLAAGPLLRVLLARLAPDHHALLVTLHHIIADGWSLGIFVRELTALYAAALHSRDHGNGSQSAASPLPPLPIQYADYARWQRDRLQGTLLETQLDYWRQQLGPPLPVLELPSDRPRPAAQSFNGARLPLALSQGLTDALQTLSRREGATLFMTLLAAFQVLLHRYTGQHDILVGSPIAGRTRAETEHLIGMFVNTLVLRSNFADNPTFQETLRRVRSTALGAYAHQELPFEKLVEVLQPERSQSYAPIFQVMFVLQNAELPAIELPELCFEPEAAPSATAKFDLTLDLRESADGVHGSIEYNTDLFDAATIARMAEQFTTLLGSIVADPARRVGSLALLSEAEQRRILEDWNATEASYPADQCFHQLVEAQALQAPEAVALVYGDQRLSYGELNTRSNQLARYLQALGVGPETRVGICIERSPDLVIGLLAILKAGGCYVPLDPGYPADRLQYMLADAQMPIVLTQASLRERLPRGDTQLVLLDRDRERIADESSAAISSGVTPDNLAYIIYTSGSTGRPKGAMIPHRGLVNYLSWASQAYRVVEGSGTLVHSPIGFDLTVTSLFVPLLVRQPVLLLPDEQGLDGLHAALAPDAAFSLVKLTPAHVDLLNAVLPAETLAGRAKALIIGGEALRAETIATWREYAPGTRLINEYGPTETVVGCCVYEVPPSGDMPKVIPIGRPIANTRLYILDRYLNPVPVGVPGELFIGGAGVGRGYLNRPELTAEKFIPDPFGATTGSRLYRSGDLARYLPDGTIDFLGRIDQQVKVRGFRIELGEIEATLLQHPAVNECVVLAREDAAGDVRLVAYVVEEQGNTEIAENRAAELRAYLQARLPEYMLPSYFVVLDTLPLTENGKVDRRALPAPETASDRSAAFVAPRTPLEEVVTQLWAEVLNVERIGVHDNFFDLGGHSLLATQIIAQVRDSFQVDLPLRSVFGAPTVASFSAEILQHASAPARVEKTAQLLIQIAEMSDTEVETMLVDRSQSPGREM
jgi:amino acid adenylation domain-containing protein